jgi:hypothetical protein
MEQVHGGKDHRWRGTRSNFNGRIDADFMCDPA